MKHTQTLSTYIPGGSGGSGWGSGSPYNNGWYQNGQIGPYNLFTDNTNVTIWPGCSVYCRDRTGENGSAGIDCESGIGGDEGTYYESGDDLEGGGEGDPFAWLNDPVSPQKTGLNKDNYPLISSSKEIFINPNPVADDLTITYSTQKASTDYVLNILDAKGVKVESKKFSANFIGQNKYSLNTKMLPAGRYIIQLNSNGCFRVATFVKQ